MMTRALAVERVDAAESWPWWTRTRGCIALVIALTVIWVGLTVVREQRFSTFREERAVLFIQSGQVLERLALSFDALVADVYWIRAIQHYGRTKLSQNERKEYHLLHPLLDITTTLDPGFTVAYRFGAIFLTEAYPDGPGRPDLAIALLQKGIEHMPDKWQYYMDIGFVYYWWLHDSEEAARWFRKGSEVPGASWWLRSLAATTLAQGGNRSASRVLWRQIYDSADNEWMRTEALRRLAQLDALDDIDVFHTAVARFTAQAGGAPASWRDLVGAGLLTGVPRDPAGHPYVLEPEGQVTVSSESPLFPLPAEPPAVR